MSEVHVSASRYLTFLERINSYVRNAKRDYDNIFGSNDVIHKRLPRNAIGMIGILSKTKIPRYHMDNDGNVKKSDEYIAVNRAMRLLIGQNLALVFNRNHCTFSICHKTDDPNSPLVPLRFYIRKLREDIKSKTISNTDEFILVDNSGSDRLCMILPIYFVDNDSLENPVINTDSSITTRSSKAYDCPVCGDIARLKILNIMNRWIRDNRREPSNDRPSKRNRRPRSK